jgi:hypothetical protein
MQSRLIIAVLVLICAAAVIAGCTGTQGTQSGSPAGTSGPAAAAVGSSLTTVPTDVVPSVYTVVVDVGQKDYLGNIPVIFQGGAGQDNVASISVKLTRTDGTTDTEALGKDKGDTVTLQGTRGTPSLTGQPDRVEVWVTMNNGQTYKVADVIREYSTR